MPSKYLLILLIFFMISCGKPQPTNEEIEKAFQEVNNETLWKELKEMVYMDQYYRGMSSGLDKSAPNYQKQRDSIWELQLAVDHKNTKRIIEITEKYGLTNPQRTGQPIGAWLLLHHAPEEYHDEIKPLVEREFKAKRMDPRTYALIKWTLNGREGLPELPESEIIDNR
ncbi:hypothetical protein [Aquimarina litoralis]|uniref:hypothetical protein n=1 Tax=Aquimarina litoralis TaxID=584605 RepID=UPI001C592758|nr:hypothetical protein [Aquimarina litoralis]MBW1297809.1 hypothetical protein [Aquimarina litoralis]